MTNSKKPRKMIFMAVDFIRRNKAAAAMGQQPPHVNIIRIWDPAEGKGISCVKASFQGHGTVCSDPLNGASHLGRPDVHAWIEVDGEIHALMEHGSVIVV